MADLDEVVTALRSGQAVVLPTDTVYGLCALPTVDGAVGRLFELKGRRRDAPVAVLCTTREQAFGLADAVSAAHRTVAGRCWPGPLTLVLRRRASLGWDLGEPADTVGLRVPDDALLHDLSDRLGPLAATSANRHGRPTARTADEVRAELGDGALVLDAGELGDVASTVVDATAEPWQVLRLGAVSVAHLEEAGAPL